MLMRSRRLCHFLFMFLLALSAWGSTIIGFSGPEFGGTTPNGGIYTAFSLGSSYSDVSISAPLGAVFAPFTVNAYLTTQIGPQATLSDQVAATSFTLSPLDDGWVTLFTGLNLPADDYYLIIATPIVNWVLANPGTGVGAPGNEYLGWGSTSKGAAYAPSSLFDSFEPPTYGLAPLFEVSTPEPPGYVLCAAVLLCLIASRLFSSALSSGLSS